MRRKARCNTLWGTGSMETTVNITRSLTVCFKFFEFLAEQNLPRSKSIRSSAQQEI